MNENLTSQDTVLASPTIICGAPSYIYSRTVGSRDTKAYKIQPLPRELCCIILNVDNASMLPCIVLLNPPNILTSIISLNIFNIILNILIR